MTQIDVPEYLLDYNNQGMAYLGSGQYFDSFRNLNAAERLLRVADHPDIISQEDHKKLMALTYNNLGCYYKRSLKPNVALRYMNNSLAIEMRLN